MDNILRVVDHLLHLSKLVTSEMMSSLRKILHEWKENGLTIGKCVKSAHPASPPLLAYTLYGVPKDLPQVELTLTSASYVPSSSVERLS